MDFADHESGAVHPDRFRLPPGAGVLLVLRMYRRELISGEGVGGQPKSGGGFRKTLSFWRNDLLAGVPRGIRNQIRASQGEFRLTGTVSIFRRRKGRTNKKRSRNSGSSPVWIPLPTSWSSGPACRPRTRRLASLSNSTWQANDPLVHYTLEGPDRPRTDEQHSVCEATKHFSRPIATWASSTTDTIPWAGVRTRPLRAIRGPMIWQ
jgi:hypothetical protein